jgi:hypothetical protein
VVRVCKLPRRPSLRRGRGAADGHLGGGARGQTSKPSLPNPIQRVHQRRAQGAAWGGHGVGGAGEKIPGLLYADDIVIFAESRKQMEASLLMLAKWMEDWHLEVNPSKCGCMVIASQAKHARLKLKLLQWGLTTIPVVDEYTYLGLQFHHTHLVVKPSLRVTRKKGWAALAGLRATLVTTEIPLIFKAIAIRETLESRILWGGELWGARSAVELRELEQILSTAVNLCFGTGKKPSSALLRLTEMGLKTVAASCAGRAVRAQAKWPGLSTWVGRLLATWQGRKRGQLVGLKKRTWVSGLNASITRHLKAAGVEEAELPQQPAKKGAAVARAWVSGALKSEATRLQVLLCIIIIQTCELFGQAPSIYGIRSQVRGGVYGIIAQRRISKF